MKIYLVKKEKGRIYKSEDILRTLFNLSLTHNENGAPLTDGGYVSISDTAAFWICALSDFPVGIDIEEEGRTVKSSVAKRLHVKEQECLAPLNSEGREWKEEFLGIWVKKEAYMKLMGKGLRMGLSSFNAAGGSSAVKIGDSYITSLRYKKLFIGIASSEEAENYSIEEAFYNAPFTVSCMDAGAGLLDSRMYSEVELSKKLLEKGYPEKDVEETVKKLKEYGYLDDERYASLLAEKLSKGKKAPKLIQLELTRRGISKDAAKRAADEYKEGSREAAFALARKCLGNRELSSLSKEEQTKMMAKVGRKLASFGYETSIIYDILDKLKL